MLKSPPLVATLSDSMRMSPCSWGDIFTWPLRGDRIIGLRHAGLALLFHAISSCYHTDAANSPIPMTNSHKNHRADYAVVGSGIAGLRAAIELSAAGSVLVLAKSNLSDSATAWAQGGIAVALSDEDEI